MREEEGPKRSGSDSNAHKHRKASHLHESHQKENDPLYPVSDADFSRDLQANDRAGENHGTNQALMAGARDANDIKELHTSLADLSDAELKSLVILPAGTRLEQGAKYIDLHRLEDGEFVATASMVASPDNYYVPKKETDYLLWNRLNQVDTPERLDETPENG